MKYRRIVGILAALVFFCGGTGKAEAPREVTVPIVMYHCVKPENPGKDAVFPEELESDLMFLKSEGYTAVGLWELVRFVYLGEPLPEKPVVLTFDDGYYNNYVYVFPLAQKYDTKIVVSVIGKSAEDFSRYPSTDPAFSHATWSELREMTDSGLAELENHTWALHSMTGAAGCLPRQGEAEAALTERLGEDVLRTQKAIYENTGQLPCALVYPYGYFTPETESAAAELGFSATVSCEYGVNRLAEGDPACLFGLGRICRYHGCDLEALIKRAPVLK